MNVTGVRVGCMAAVVVWGGLVGAARGQWTVTELSPAGEEIFSSAVHAMPGARQGGEVSVAGVPHASVWSGTAASWVDLHPAGAQASSIYAIDGDQQAGFVTVVGGITHASLWSGPGAAWIDLHPAGAEGSTVLGARGGVQVGKVWASGVSRASLWTGTASSRVDLHPPGASYSYAYAVDGGQQGGLVYASGVWRATLWNGSAGSVVDLHPDASAIQSVVTAMNAGRQVGRVTIQVSGSPPFQGRAGLWSGTASSWVSLHPMGALDSEADAIHGEFQAGWASFPGAVELSVEHAGVWRGTAESWEDLSQVLSGPWGATFATSVWDDGETLYVAGYGMVLETEMARALLWTRPLCGTSDFNGDGDFGTDGDIEAFFACLAGNCCATCFGRGADFNGDGDVGTDADIESFFRVLAGNAC